MKNTGYHTRQNVFVKKIYLFLFSFPLAQEWQDIPEHSRKYHMTRKISKIEYAVERVVG